MEICAGFRGATQECLVSSWVGGVGLVSRKTSDPCSKAGLSRSGREPHSKPSLNIVQGD
jgi:hypothetical protein